MQIQYVSGAESVVGIGATPSSGGTTDVGYSNSGRPALEYYTLTATSLVGVHTTAQIHSTWKVSADFNWSVSNSSATSNVRYWAGFASNIPAYGTSTQAPFANDNYTSLGLIGFRFSSTAGDGTFQCVLCNSGTGSTSATSVTPTNGVNYKMKLDFQPTSIKYFINGNLACTITTNYPNFVALQPAINSQTLETTAKHIRFHRITVRSND